MAVLYRINAQSRAIEDALTREGLPYRIVGGVRFYERKEIKDALAYLKLVINPHDDVSFRRVVNTPPRGIGKAVMDALEQADPAGQDGLPPLGQAGLFAVSEKRSLWARAEHVLAGRRLAPRAHASLKAFVDLITDLSSQNREPDQSIGATIERTLERAGYFQDLQEEQSEEARERLANLAELVSAAREYEEREDGASLGGFVDRLSLLSEADEAAGFRTRPRLADDDARGQGARVPGGHHPGHGREAVPAQPCAGRSNEMEEERRLCYVGITRAERRLYLASAARRRIFGEYQPTEPSRFLGELPQELLQCIESPTLAYASRRPAAYEMRVNPYPQASRKPPDSVRDKPTQGYRYEDEDQSSPDLRPGLRVRHPTFGVGTVLSVEPADADTKLTVRFSSVGRKKLIAKFARLEPV